MHCNSLLESLEDEAHTHIQHQSKHTIDKTLFQNFSIFPAEKKEEAGSCPPVVIPVPSKRGRKKKSTLPLVGSATGGDTLMLGHLPGQVAV